MTPLPMIEGRSLRELTTLRVGGPARALVEAREVEDVRRTLDYADAAGLGLAVLGGGSNVLVSDEGFDGIVLRYLARDMRFDSDSGRGWAAAGLEWDTLAQRSVDLGLGGLETTVGIPGWVGAAPVQNIGAYGQELSEVLERVECVDLRDGSLLGFSREECAFAYRGSRFKGVDRGRYLITALELQLAPASPPNLSYSQLRDSFGEGSAPPTLQEVASRVRQLRREKGMLIADDSPELSSAGSFFTNPILELDQWPDLEARVLELGSDPNALPQWPAGKGRVKCSAAWLIEASGLHKGHRSGRVGLSPYHVLALVNLGGATAREIVAFAREVRDRVLEATGVRLRPEPIPLGFDKRVMADLWGD